MTKTSAALCPLLLGFVLVPACEDQPAKPAAALVTMATLHALGAVPEGVRFGGGLDAVFTDGFEPDYFLKGNNIRIASAFTERATSAYMTTDVWMNFPEVWVQPLYIVRTPKPRARWIFSVAEDSKFYSPFWVAYEVTVPDETLERYSSVRDVLDAKLPFGPGRGQLTALVPDGVQPAKVDDDAFVRTLLDPLPTPAGGGDKLTGTYRVGTTNGWVDGRPRQYIDFGVDRFEWNERDEIVEAPLFFFFTKRSDGSWGAVTDLPRVGGTGPLYGRRPAIAPGNRPLFGSFWRLWGVHLPLSARVFIPPAKSEVWTTHRTEHADHPVLPETGGALVAALDDQAMQASIERHAFQVVLDQIRDPAALNACRATAANDEAKAACTSCVNNATNAAELDACAWLDSQAAIEDHITRDGLLPSQILVSCPYLAYGSRPSALAEPQ
jgi:hypothetical protein